MALSISSCVSWETKKPKTGSVEIPKAAEAPVIKIENSNPETIDISSLSPYFIDVFGGEAAKALAEDRLEDAMRLFDDIAKQVEDPILTPRARFMSAYLAHRLGDHSRALAELPGLAQQIPALADVAWDSAALSAMRLKKYDRAIGFSKKVSQSSVFAPSAALLAADCNRRSKRYEKAAEDYRSFLETWPDSDGKNEARANLVECLAQIFTVGDKTDQAPAREALRLIDLLRAQSPGGRWTRSATEHEKKLLEGLDEKYELEREELPSALKAYEKALSLKNKMKNAEALKAYTKAVKKARKNGNLRCTARFEKALVLTRLRKHDESALLFDEVAAECKNPNIRVKALYNGAKAFMSSDRPAEAIRLFSVIEEEFTEHSYADDARLHTARCQLMRGSEETFVELLTTLPDQYPSGDMRSEALWIAAKHSLEKNELVSAREILNRYFELFPREEGWYIAGRSGYWAGRIAELDKDIEKAADFYERTISTAPLSYYMLMAHARLKNLYPKRAVSLMARLSPPGGEVSARFSPKILEEVQGFATGVELLRLGLTTKARRQLEHIMSRSDTPAEVHWITASLFRAAGEFNAATAVTTSAAANWKQRYPSGADLMQWTLAYPTAFEKEVEIAARESDVDRAMLWAVMREESGFNTKVESWANAIGLMQIILPTAKSMGKRIGITFKRKDLKNPAINIRLGAAYLAYLSEKFDGHPALMIAGYNAGEGAVAKWLKASPKSNLDLFVEEIPYKQTRGYTKRVLSSLVTYKFLYEENRPILEPEMKLP